MWVDENRETKVQNSLSKLWLVKTETSAWVKTYTQFFQVAIHRSSPQTVLSVPLWTKSVKSPRRLISTTTLQMPVDIKKLQQKKKQ